MTTVTRTVVERIAAFGVLPVVVVRDVRTVEGLGRALKAGGLPVAEVTLRTDAALEALRSLAEDPDLLVGAGTVTRPEQIQQARAAGAQFLVSPGFSHAVIREAALVQMPVIPGVATATEIQIALEAGVSVLKFFPAETAGGSAALKALAAPFPDVRFVPTGGIVPDNVADYLRLPSVLAVGGSWLVAADLLAAGDFDRVTELTREAVALVHGIREGR